MVLGIMGEKMKKFILISAVALLAACESAKNINMNMDLAAPSNPTAAEEVNARGDYMEPLPPATNETEVEIMRDYPAYKSDIRYNN